jgi:hypothetical protein
MKKSKILIVGLIGLLMAGGLVLMSCEDECTNPCELYTTGAGRSSSSCSRGECAVVKALNSGGTSATCSCN